MIDSGMPSIPSSLTPPVSSYSKSNRRASTTSPVQRAYPWLLFASTAVAAVFCLMYITKPIIQASQATGQGLPDRLELPKSVKASAKTSLLPDNDRLPGEKAGVPARSASTLSTPAPDAFEQTNLRIQHILTAEAPGGRVAKIDLDVPVLYQSRNLRWTAAEVAEARELLMRLADYQEKSRMLRAEAMGLLDSWNGLIERSIPVADLRADSPTLPINQQDAADAPRPASLDTTELIQIQPAGK